KITGSLVPEGFQIEREDILNRAQTEWQFIVLSARLYQSYRDELQDLRDKFAKLSKFDPGLFEDLKGFWSKVQGQVREKNLFREHADKIRKSTDALFDELKKLRRSFDEEFRALSEKHMGSFKDKLAEIDKKIEDGLSLQNIFQELKDLQREFRNTDFTGDHRSQVWKILDGLFKKVKEKKFGPRSDTKSDPLARIKRRYDGLIAAIEKMERSIARDRKEMEFQNKRMEDSDGSLESQLRAAKSKMIEERVLSKEAKLTEMKATQTELERKMQNMEARKQKQKLEEKLKEEIKQKIAQDIREAEIARADNEEVQKAAEAILKTKAEPTIEEKIQDGLEDIIDTIKAVAAVIEDNFREVLSDSSATEEE
ncbi:MAG: hypothetical protein HKN76_03165, partial [Saprospiraceae bacterium]|nr:hypothetical protein [Saprospiraceae bacterium]